MRRREMAWVRVAAGVPYFELETGEAWHPIGFNDAISWAELNPLFRRRDVPAVRAYLQGLVEHGVTCLRLMLEYAQVRHRYFESAVGVFAPAMVQLWDDLFALCEEVGLRVLLTPFDTFWMWLHFRHHPYNAGRGGPLKHPSRTLLDAEMREAIKGRLTFAAERWGGSGALFAWDLWNEIHPAQAEMSSAPFLEFIGDLSEHVRGVERARFGRTHPQTVSLFGPELVWRPEMTMEGAIFRHPGLDFANLHVYQEGTIDDPQNTVDAAIGMGRIVEGCLREIEDGRPFFDSEHGPIHTFKDKKVTLPAAFDDEYFRHMQWAHLASGGAGGGMRWPNRRPHRLTAGMHVAQRGMARFLPEVAWQRFARRSVAVEVREAGGAAVGEERVARFGCATGDQAVVYLLRRDTVMRDGRLDPGAAEVEVEVRVPGLEAGQYCVTSWDTDAGARAGRTVQEMGDGWMRVSGVVRDLAVALRQV